MFIGFKVPFLSHDKLILKSGSEVEVKILLPPLKTIVSKGIFKDLVEVEVNVQASLEIFRWWVCINSKGAKILGTFAP